MTNAERAFQLTPSRRATERGVRPRATLEFQLTPSRRATGIIAFVQAIASFQLTPSRRATSSDISSVIRQENFNSRPHGGRLPGGDSGSGRDIFQLTPSRRATPFPCAHCIIHFIFQLTPSRRATIHNARRGSSTVFQLTPSRRATYTAKIKRQEKHFNSRPHGGRHFVKLMITI